MTIAELLAHEPAPLRIPGARALIRRLLLQRQARLAIVDDDPTGGQTIHGARVYLDWTVDRLRSALARHDPVLFVCSNSRSMAAHEAEAVSEEIGHNLAAAAGEQQSDVLLALRGDSTLRGHFPGEVEAIVRGFGHACDAVLLAPAFFEAGRYTVGDVQWVQQGNTLLPAHETEFARDPAFGYRDANLRAWVEEKTGGAVSAERVRSLSLATIRRGGPDAVTAALLEAHGAEPVIVNAACYEDLEVVALGVAEAEARGKRLFIRCSASFVKARGGFGDRPLLSADEMGVGSGPGLVVVGSYVERTSRQLARLLSSGLVESAELSVRALLDAATGEAEVRRVGDWANRTLARASHVCVYTSRNAASVPREQFLAAGQRIVAGLRQLVAGLRERPAWLVAKGGVTSLQVASTALRAQQAEILGQILPGVPVWALGDESRWPGLPLVVFPGNVGGEDALLAAVTRLASPAAAGQA